MTQSLWRLLWAVRGWLAGGRAVGAPVGPGPAGPTRPLRIRRPAGGVAGPAAAVPETAAALRSYGMDGDWKGGGREGKSFEWVNDVDCSDQ